MSPQWMTRSALAWLLLAQFAIIAPQLPLLPIWTAAVWLLVAYWQWRIYRGDWHFPPAIVKWLLAAAAVAGIFVEYRTALELEPQLALLICAFILKLLELKSYRDLWILIFLGYFIVACGFIFEFGFSALFVALLQVSLLLLAQQAMFRQRTELLPMIRVNWRLLYQSLPLMLVLFLVFPRFGPLWSMPVPGQSGRTGLSDSMAPGDISQLLRSGELAFRVSFNDGIPPPFMLYWRGLVLEDFDGRSWSRNEVPWPRRSQEAAIRSGSEPLSYEVTLEPGVHRWLLSLAVARSSRQDIYLNQRYELLPRQVLTGRLHYPVDSYIDAVLDERLETFQRVLNLRLPRGFNPRAQELGQSWRDRHEQPEARLQAALDYFSERPFVYTLEPPRLGRDSVDEFLFDTRRGFCEHFASSFVVLMREAGVPARVVVGYQGGERAPGESYLRVRQLDAHAWAEVWLEGRGWVQVDPTQLVAPERIEQGSQILSGESGYMADSPLRRLGTMAWANNLRFWMDRMEYNWSRWVLNFDNQRQSEFISRWLGHLDGRQFAVVVFSALAAPLVVVGLLTLRRSSPQRRELAVRRYLACCRWLEKRGFEREPGEAPNDFAARVRAEKPEWGAWIDSVTREFYTLQYRPVEDEEYQRALQSLATLRRGPD